MKKNFSFSNKSGYTDSRGEWRPEKPISFAPLFAWSPKLSQFLIWLFNYIFTWNIIYLGIVLLSYYYLQAPLSEMRTFQFSWIAIIFLRNMALVWIVYGGWHLYLYKYKKRGTNAKYSPRWQSTKGVTFLWNDQVYDNIFWACCSAVPIWTAFEVMSFWLYANDKLPYLDFKEHPAWFVLLFLLIPLWRELHFYLIHRLIHWKPLYNKIHYLHHYNINPGPWSGLAMHPVEHLLYFSVVLIHWIVPSHPLHFLFNSQHTALTPAPSHTGFEGKIAKYLPFGSYFHYLHHRLFECNYGETTVPLDKWFGIFEDGSQTQTEKHESARTFGKLCVTMIVDDSPEVKSFFLSSTDDTALKQNIPGQHLTFKIPFHQKELFLSDNNTTGIKIKYALRSYSISNNREKNQYRISVKKEKDGQVSSALHQSLEVGDILKAKGPLGTFTLKQNKSKTTVFIAAGIGITPILSMLHSLKRTNQNIFLFLAVKEEKLLPFQKELLEVCKLHPNLQVNVFFSQKTAKKVNQQLHSWTFHSKRIDFESIKTILPANKNFNFYICGPSPMTHSFVLAFEQWQGKNCIINTETFGPETKKTKNINGNKNIQVHFSKSNKSIEWDDDFMNILEFAESNGISLEAGCMFGECGACSTEIDNGQVEYNFATAAKPAKGNCLPCSCRPTSNIELNA